MSDTPLVLALPDDLLERASAADLDLRQVLIEALEHRLPPPKDEVSRILALRLPAAQVEAAQNTLRNGERILGLHAGTITIRGDFDDPLPDEFWLGSDT